MASGKAAASGEPRRTVCKYVEARREARTNLGAFFNILLCLQALSKN